MSKKQFLKSIKALDILLFILCIIIGFFSITKALEKKDAKAQVIIETPQGKWTYPLEEDRDLEFIGTLGISKVRIKNGEAFFIDSPCPNKTCMLSLSAKKTGDWVACLPNRIFLRIEGNEDEENLLNFDAISN